MAYVACELAAIGAEHGLELGTAGLEGRSIRRHNRVHTDKRISAAVFIK